MASEPTICPFCWGDPLGRIGDNEDLLLFAGRFEVCSVMAYRCAQGHLFLIPNDVLPLGATGNEILV
jgi:hypothetical protein